MTRAWISGSRKDNIRAFVVFGLGYGDEGKGQVVDHLVREHDVGTCVANMDSRVHRRAARVDADATVLARVKVLQGARFRVV